MKKLILLFLVTLFLAGTLGIAFANDDEIGAGLDIKVVDFDGYVDSVNLELKRDIQNDESTGYLMLHLDISNIFKQED